jgi:hypothetical protein
MDGTGRVRTGGRRSVWLRAVFAVTVIVGVARPSAAGAIMGISWDGSPPGTLADITGRSDFSLGVDPFVSGVYQVTWLGGVTAWRDQTTIGAGTQTVFNPGEIASGTSETLTMTSSWSMWATTPDLSFADSTGPQWAIASLDSESWLWGLEDIALGHSDADYQDAYGTLTRLGSVPTPPPPPAVVSDETLVPVPEPATVNLVAIGIVALVAGKSKVSK